MSNNTKKFAAASVNCISEHTFVPDMEQKTEMTTEQKKAAFLSRMAGNKVTSAVYKLPSNGKHIVVIDSWDIVFPKDNSAPYFAFEVKEVAKNIKWKMNITAEKDPDRKYDVDIWAFMNEVNSFNNAMLYGKELEDGLNFLMSHEFTVWTQQYENKNRETKCQTFSNPNQYNYWAGREAAKKADFKKADEAYKAHKSAEKASK